MIVEFNFKLYKKYPGISTKKVSANTEKGIIAEIKRNDRRISDVEIISIREGK